MYFIIRELLGFPKKHCQVFARYAYSNNQHTIHTEIYIYTKTTKL